MTCKTPRLARPARPQDLQDLHDKEVICDMRYAMKDPRQSARSAGKEDGRPKTEERRGEREKR